MCPQKINSTHQKVFLNSQTQQHFCSSVIKECRWKSKQSSTQEIKGKIIFLSQKLNITRKKNQAGYYLGTWTQIKIVNETEQDANDWEEQG